MRQWYWKERIWVLGMLIAMGVNASMTSLWFSVEGDLPPSLITYGNVWKYLAVTTEGTLLSFNEYRPRWWWTPYSVKDSPPTTTNCLPQNVSNTKETLSSRICVYTYTQTHRHTLTYLYSYIPVYVTNHEFTRIPPVSTQHCRTHCILIHFHIFNFFLGEWEMSSYPKSMYLFPQSQNIHKLASELLTHELGHANLLTRV